MSLNRRMQNCSFHLTYHITITDFLMVKGSDAKHMLESLQKLQKLLYELFRADAEELKFGIYRIINYRREQFQTFIDEKLPTIVDNALNANAEIESTRQEIEHLKEQIIQNFGNGVLDDDGNLINETYRNTPLVQKYLEVVEQVGSPLARDQRADTVFNYLYAFFSRYYENGDFIPRRRYSQTERYTIPYNGEEVYLHWANRDQYYVKSGEYFSTYRFKSQDITVIFDIQNVDIEKDNIKGEKRFFIPLSAETKYYSERDEVCIPFEYRPLTDDEKQDYGKGTQQDKIQGKINKESRKQILEQISDNFKIHAALDQPIGTKTILEKHFENFTARNTADFFIHKDLEKFLNRELDVYIKNEVMPLSSRIFEDVHFQEDNLTQVGWIETAKLVNTIASQIINFLSHIEEFQKRLWLKKKFVLSTDYCLTLSRVPEEFYPEITKNTDQLNEWKDLFSIHEIDSDFIDADGIESLSVDFLNENPNLVLDTCHFTPNFKDRLLSHFDDLDNETNGLLIHGENFQGINLLTEKYRESLKTIYIDPPYNTGGTDFVYKNSYQHSSWFSFMADRIAISHELLSQDGAIFISIDDNEVHHLRMLMNKIFGESNFIAQFFWMRTATPPSLSKTVRKKMEPIICYKKSKRLNLFGGQTEGGDMPLLNETNAIRQLEFPRDSFRRVNLKDGIYKAQRYGKIRLVEEIEVRNGQFLDSLIMEGKFKWSQETVQDEIEAGTLFHIKSDKFSIRYERDQQKRVKVPSNLITQKECQVGTNEEANTELKEILGTNKFDYPKPTSLLKYLINMNCTDGDIVFDYFSGSGTTAHAVIDLNRQDDGKRKYILIEMGYHFDTVLKPRIKKAVYAEKWKNAKPVSRDSRLSHIIKYQRIESYEDALNNIEFTEPKHENLLLEEHPLSYMLESDTMGSPTLLNVAKLENPFSYQLTIVKDMQKRPQTVDLPETFNYLLGLFVNTRHCYFDNDRRYLVYKGTVEHKYVVIIWRETAGWKEEDWERDCRFIEEHKMAEDATEVYVNTNSIVPEAVPLDPIFKRLMFSK